MFTKHISSKVLSVATSFLAIGAVALLGKPGDASAMEGNATLQNTIEKGDIQLNYVEIGDVDNGGGNPPFPE